MTNGLNTAARAFLSVLPDFRTRRRKPCVKDLTCPLCQSSACTAHLHAFVNKRSLCTHPLPAFPTFFSNAKTRVTRTRGKGGGGSLAPLPNSEGNSAFVPFIVAAAASSIFFPPRLNPAGINRLEFMLCIRCLDLRDRALKLGAPRHAIPAPNEQSKQKYQ